ncbi:hypothetical protein N9H39_01965 [Gammaproteobacteria bacterium]|nr:hypothetical protein [Gammaproteobacteria bacterium]
MPKLEGPISIEVTLGETEHLRGRKNCLTLYIERSVYDTHKGRDYQADDQEIFNGRYLRIILEEIRTSHKAQDEHCSQGSHDAKRCQQTNQGII